MDNNTINIKQLFGTLTMRSFKRRFGKSWIWFSERTTFDQCACNYA